MLSVFWRRVLFCFWLVGLVHLSGPRTPRKVHQASLACPIPCGVHWVPWCSKGRTYHQGYFRKFYLITKYIELHIEWTDYSCFMLCLRWVFFNYENKNWCRSFSGRCAESAWWFFTLILVASYTANLAAFLTVESMDFKIRNVDDLVSQTKVKYGTVQGGSSEDFFRVRV